MRLSIPWACDVLDDVLVKQKIISHACERSERHAHFALTSGGYFVVMQIHCYATGLNGTPMVSFETTLTPEQRWDIIAYLFTLKLPDMPTLGAAPASSLLLQNK